MLKEYDDLKEKIINSNKKTLSYIHVVLFFKCRKNTESKNPKAVNTKNKKECFYQTLSGHLLYEMNKTINKFLLAGDKCMREMHLREPECNYSACQPFTKNKERIQKIKQIG